MPRIMSERTRPRPVVLCVLDGWGDAAPSENNAISCARTPVWDALIATCPNADAFRKDRDAAKIKSKPR